ncbi:hypothetical protein [Pseudomonas fulva]|uniref:hypothetical protein n=1 Tax=Pseudomonas fulva TaxID=47880 RepID=UPI0018A96D4F|nr:hypothetical protein [Pseudomonas fulva]MBF8774027.1 hypothetical protein [Pseudomonas fulva]QPN43691.1 hypothetical protein I5S86_19375 [Priestia aryabhattai]
MGSKRKPFITCKALSLAVIESGITRNWPAPYLLEIWQLASLHLTEEAIGAAFGETVSNPGYKSLIMRRDYKVTASDTLHFPHPPNSSCNPIYILSEKFRDLVKSEWPWPEPEHLDCKWHDFSLLLLDMLLKENAAPLRLKGKLLEEDLGI